MMPTAPLHDSLIELAAAMSQAAQAAAPRSARFVRTEAPERLDTLRGLVAPERDLLR
jgi:hypothetical protein